MTDAASVELAPRLADRRASLADAQAVERRAANSAVSALIATLLAAGAAATDAFRGVDAALVASIVVTVAAMRWRMASTARRERLAFAVHWFERTDDRRRGRFDHGQPDGAEFADPSHEHATELGLFGPDSLYYRLNDTVTPFGARRLAAILSAVHPPADPQEQQAAVRELTSDADTREALEVELRCWQARLPRHSIERERLLRRTVALEALHEDADLDSSMSSWQPYVWLALAALSTAAWIAVAMEWTPLWVGAAAHAVNAAVLISDRSIARIMARFESVDRTLEAWSQILEVGERMRPASPSLAAVRDALLNGGTPASTAIAELHRITHRLSQRRNALYAATLDVAWLIDLHAKRRLLEWCRRHGRDVGEWFAASAQLEALASLAGYAESARGHAWPEFLPAATPRFDAADLTHPLLPAETRVGNDCAIERPGTIWVVTGSNMSGKSTFLRAAGLAVVMANAGLPVAARRLRLATCSVVASMRIADSLASGTSLFLAEVRRIKRCLDVARESPRTLVLLDEILAGTNSRERHIGVMAVLRELARQSTFTLVSTHDVALGEIAAELPQQSRVVHFGDRISDGRMTFDYRVREGALRTTNALRVMASEGLPVDTPPSP